jgi:hypothetical protein
MRAEALDKRLRELEQKKPSHSQWSLENLSDEQVREKLRWYNEIFCGLKEQSREERI